ncbi:helix-turn-helix transcriptional regulator [Azospirillum sp. B510]|uniref:helix-turn-helix transcriptional regulator n=1 Tax=Azospirillum sp. (strain B510) TaxID=137722 RepID=UPI000B34A58C|nr:AlpA family phage regulatory protein [Azospirillum sp. B510]
MVKFFRKKDLIEMGVVGSEATLYRLIKDGRFPPGAKVGSSRIWRPSDIDGLFTASAGNQQ